VLFVQVKEEDGLVESTKTSTDSAYRSRESTASPSNSDGVNEAEIRAALEEEFSDVEEEEDNGIEVDRKPDTALVEVEPVVSQPLFRSFYLFLISLTSLFVFNLIFENLKILIISYNDFLPDCARPRSARSARR
jgi:hypothetical protein